MTTEPDPPKTPASPTWPWTLLKIILIPIAAFFLLRACIEGLNQSWWNFSENPGAPAFSQARNAGNLGAIRSALSIYYGDMKGLYPTDPNTLTVQGKYMKAIPPAFIWGKHHPNTSDFHFGRKSDDAGGWMYDNDPSSDLMGTVMVNCTHTDGRGRQWTVY